MTAQTTSMQDPIVVGVDTHKDSHHAAVLTSHGQLVADREFPANAAGYRELAQWAARYGAVTMFAVESTGTYGSALSRSLLAAGHDVREINRPHAYTKAHKGKRT